MRAGLLTKRIDIYRPEVSTNEFGEKIKNEKFFYTTRTNVVYNSGNRTLEAQSEITYDYSYSFEMYKYVPVMENDIIHYNYKKYKIISIEDRDVENRKIVRTELINE